MCNILVVVHGNSCLDDDDDDDDDESTAHGTFKPTLRPPVVCQSLLTLHLLRVLGPVDMKTNHGFKLHPSLLGTGEQLSGATMLHLFLWAIQYV